MSDRKDPAAIVELDSTPPAPRLLAEFSDLLKAKGFEVQWRLRESRGGLPPDVVNVIEIAVTLLVGAATTVAFEHALESCVQVAKQLIAQRRQGQADFVVTVYDDEGRVLRRVTFSDLP